MNVEEAIDAAVMQHVVTQLEATLAHAIVDTVAMDTLAQVCHILLNTCACTEAMNAIN